jgi:hypothetical protein
MTTLFGGLDLQVLVPKSTRHGKLQWGSASNGNQQLLQTNSNGNQQGPKLVAWGY